MTCSKASWKRIAAGVAVALAACSRADDLDAGFLPHIFEPFRQADGTTTRTHRGLGLGLAITLAAPAVTGAPSPATRS